jgi:hypothetical protein
MTDDWTIHDNDEAIARYDRAARRLIAAFPATGKTHYASLHPDRVADSDSSHYSWEGVGEDRRRHPDWPNNYRANDHSRGVLMGH